MVRILIDMQGVQTESRFRGIGRYSMALTLSMIRNSKGHDIHLLLNKTFAETIEPIRSDFKDLLPDHKIHEFEAIEPNHAIDSLNEWRVQASKLIREAFIDGLKPGIVFCPSFFEGFIDGAVTSIGLFSDIPVVATLHDLIPLIFKADYLSEANGYDRFYLEKVDQLKRADALLTISASSSSEAYSLLGFSDKSVVNTSEAADEKFRKQSIPVAEASSFLGRYGIQSSFLFYTGGADPRKNLRNLLAAFASLPAAILQTHQLVLAGRIPIGEERQLLDQANHLDIAAQVVFTGYVSDDDLIKLYSLARAFVFPSLYEGFGLPVLEAMQCGLPTIASNTSSIPEVVGLDEALFDPRSTTDIAAKIERVLIDGAFRQRLITHAAVQCSRFSWTKSGEVAVDALAKFAKRQGVDDSWQVRRDNIRNAEKRLITAIAAIPASKNSPDEQDLVRTALAIANNYLHIERHQRPTKLPTTARWRFEGPFDSSYSLALVNRELARAICAQGQTVTLWSSEGPGDFAPAPEFLRENPDIKAMHARALTDPSPPNIVSRNMYPPRVIDMDSAINSMHCYAWEETGFPLEWADAYNENLQFLTVTSHHVKKLLRDSGVSIPIAVVGNGVDHWLPIEPSRDRPLTPGFKFLHVSSCFPRKGIDILIESYGRAFTSDDDVTLIIKTFANPHNCLEKLLAVARAKNTKYPNVEIIYDDLSAAQMKALYERCDVLVAPSRAEGFGLPLAEAILSGTAVITTNWGGQLDFCSSSEIDMIDFRYVPATSHLGIPNSVWAEPSMEHLTALLRSAFGEPLASRKSRVQAAKERLLAHYKWSDVAQRQIRAARHAIADISLRKPRIAWVTTFNQRCGIATYSAHLLNALDLRTSILAPEIASIPSEESDNITRCWIEGNEDDLSRLEDELTRGEFDTIIVQFNYGFFNLRHLSSLLQRAIARGVHVIITLHSTVDPKDASKRLVDLKPALIQCERILVHSLNDMNRLKTLGIVGNVTLLPHGILNLSAKLTKKPSMRNVGSEKLIATYGFFLPNKGILELIQAVALLRADGCNCRLRLVNAEYPVADSRNLIQEAKRLIRALNLQSAVELHTDFLADEESLRLIASADLVVYNYQKTAESASGAVRYGLASSVPVAVSESPIFDDLSDVVFRLKGGSIQDLAASLRSALSSIDNQDSNLIKMMEQADRWRLNHSYTLIGRRLRGMLIGLHGDKLADLIDRPIH
jgi:glycosyltransferase involved in cell wall biosynthesis